MAKDIYDKLKIISDIFKANWPMILMGLTALSSGLTNLNQYFIGEEDDLIKNAMAEQITILAKPHIKPKEIVVKSACGNCGNYLKQHIRDLH